MMTNIEKVIEDLNITKNILVFPQMLTPEMCVKIGQAINSAIDLLKEQETIFEKDGHHIRCISCGNYWCDTDREGDPFPYNYCPECGRKVMKCVN